MTRKKSDHAKGKSVACKLGALSDNGNRKTARNVTRAAAGVVVGPGEGGIRLIDETSARDFNDLSSEVCETKVVGLASPTELEPYDTFTSDEGRAAYDASRLRNDHSRTDSDREKVAIKLTIGKRKNAMKTASDSCYVRDNAKSHDENKTPETEDTYDFDENERNCNNNNNISGSERLPTTVTDSSDDLFKPILTPEGDKVLEVQCGENQALLYLAKLCQGSKGACIRWGVEWLTPNQFQKASGRQTAKDWKRSIRHHGKSMKLLLNKGFISIHSLVCACIQCHDQPLYKRRLQRRADKPSNKLPSGHSADLASMTNDSGAVTVNKSPVYDEDDAASDSTIEMTEYSVRDVSVAKEEPELIGDTGALQNLGNHGDTTVVAMGKPHKIDEKKKNRKLKRERKAEGDSLVGDCDKVRSLNESESERLSKKKRRKERKKRRIADEMNRVGTMEAIGTGTGDLVQVPRANFSAMEESGTHTGSIDEASNETLVVTEEESEKCIEKAAHAVYVGYDAKQNDTSAAKLNLYDLSDVKMCETTGNTNTIKDLATRNHNDEKVELTERLNVVDPAEITVSPTNYPDSNADTPKSPTSTVGTVNNKGDGQMKDLSGSPDMGDQRESRLGSIINRLNKGLLKSESPQEMESPDTHQVHQGDVEPTAIDENGNKWVVSQELNARQNEIVDNATAQDKDACHHNEEESLRCKSPPERDDVIDAGGEDVQISTHKPKNTHNSVSPFDIDSSLIEDDQVRKPHTGRKKVTAEVRPYGFLFNQVTEKRAADNDKDEVISLIAPANPEKADHVARFSSPRDVIASVYGSDNAHGQTSPCKDISSGSNQGQTKLDKSQREDVQTNKFSSLTRVSNKQTIATVAPRVTITPKSNVTSYTPLATPMSSSTSIHNDITPLSASHQRDSALQQYPFNMPFPFPYAMPFAFPGWLPMTQDTAALQKNGSSPFGLNSMTDQSYMRGYLPMTAPYCYNPYLTNPLFSPYAGYLPSQTQQKDESKTRANPLSVPHKSPTSSGNYSSSKSSPQYQTNGNSSCASKRSHKDAGLDLSKKSTTDNLPLNLSVAKKHTSSEKHEKSRSRSMTNGHSSAKKAKPSRDSYAVGHNRDSDASKSHQCDGNSVQSKPRSESTKPVASNKPSNTQDLNSQVNHDVISCQATQNTDTITTLQNDNALKKGKSSTCKCRQKGTKYPNIWKWDVDQVCSFLSALNGCAHYAEVFRHHHIDGMVLPLLTVDQLMKSLQMTLRPAVLLVETVSKLLDAYSRDLCESCRSQRLVV